jgi:hypothetical protein
MLFLHDLRAAFQAQAKGHRTVSSRQRANALTGEAEKWKTAVKVNGWSMMPGGGHGDLKGTKLV